jgi:hypothetical protein
VVLLKDEIAHDVPAKLRIIPPGPRGGCAAGCSN